VLRSARGLSAIPGFLLVLLALTVVACANGFAGDPAPPIAFGVDSTHALSAVKILLCPGERVVSIALARDVSTKPGFKAGPALWQLEATSASTVATFEPGKPVEGFKTLVAASPPISGVIVVQLRTTSTTAEAGIDTVAEAADSTTLAGQVLDAHLARLVIKNRCD
jgi:hypothetical protein